MRAFTPVGEVLITFNGRRYKLRPSFINLARIGSPQEIIDCFNVAFSDRALREIDRVSSKSYCFKAMSGFSATMLSGCLKVVSSCCDDDLPKELTGFKDLDAGYGKWRYFRGGLSPVDLVVLARHLLDFGMIGKPMHRSGDGDAKEEGFDPMRFIAFAATPAESGGLGKSMSDARDLTMIEFQALYDSTHPEIRQKSEQKEKDKKLNSELDSIEEVLRKLEEAERNGK